MSSASGFKDHFSGHAASYAAHRPTYPPELAAVLAGLAPGRERALDAGCGSGQLSVLLAGHFAEVVATDASPQQIAQATPHPNVAYRIARAEASGLPAASVDLVTVAQAAHWFDLDAFYAEVRRIARPDAVLALVAYGVFCAEPDIDPVLQRFYREDTAPYWPPERRHIEAGYRTLPFPLPEIATPKLAITVDWRLGDLVGYIDTWSAVRAMEKASGRGAMDRFAADLAAVWGAPERARPIRFPLSLRVGRVG
ncbi:class I SAM-dependent methyltransferase [Blastochloris sulfoviridis]|uniref:Methyltransferase domain-containing protein n=1 Tax=Blastochloris sulfoviridis TaxID=50712 RepID=A0A5M6HUF2_9HYPH|nr:class I SAM-dependent methyltransferase [Blastochloris sulfoviridis]KAA5599520.1 methyltransferase domain-containing protein [Blastochloris sulfoviridis]